MTPRGRAQVALAALALAAILFLFVFPTRSYLGQRREVGAAEHDVTVLQKQNEKLEKEMARLQTPAEIERVAREQFNMAKPGEQVYHVLPAASTTTTVP